MRENCIWLILLSIMISLLSWASYKFYYIIFSLLNEISCTILFSHSAVDGHLGLVSSRPVVNSSLINTSVQISLLYVDLESFRCIFHSGIAGLCDSWILIFLMKPHFDFYIGSKSLHSCQQWTMVPLSSHSQQYLL